MTNAPPSPPPSPAAVPPSPAELEEIAARAAHLGGRCALEWFARAPTLAVEDKASRAAPGRAELVTVADRDVEAAVRAAIATDRPHDGFLGEESGASASRTGIVWCVDPIDATANFVAGRVDWAVSVAALDALGGPVAGAVVAPALDEAFRASRGNGARGPHAVLAPSGCASLAEACIELGAGRGRRAQLGRVVDAVLGAARDVRRHGCAALALCAVAAGRVDGLYAPDLHLWDCAAGMVIAAEAGATVSTSDGVLVAATPLVHGPLRELVDATLAR